jgi:F0F1-type ATP synthase assembly protein I
MRLVAALIIGILIGMATGHLVIVQNDGTVCAEIK